MSRFQCAEAFTPEAFAFLLSAGGILDEMPDHSSRTARDPFEQRAILASKAGDPAAYDYLVEKYSRPVLGIAHGLVRNASDAEDLAQEAFVKAYRTLVRFREGESFGPWIYRIVTNLSLDLLRKQKGRDESLDEATAEVAASRLDDADREVTARELGDAIDRAIEELPPMQRTVARLSLVEEFSHAEIAGMIGIREATVRSHLTYARTRLQKTLIGMTRT